MRTLSDAFKKALFAQESDEVVICLLTVDHEELTTPFYFSSDNTSRISENPLMYATVSRGREYYFVPFDFILPEDKSDVPPKIMLTVENIDRQIVPLLRSFTTPPSILVEIVLKSAPSIVEMDFPEMQMANATIVDSNIQIELVCDALLTEPFPGGTFTPGAFPGLF